MRTPPLPVVEPGALEAAPSTTCLNPNVLGRERMSTQTPLLGLVERLETERSGREGVFPGSHDPEMGGVTAATNAALVIQFQALRNRTVEELPDNPVNSLGPTTAVDPDGSVATLNATGPEPAARHRLRLDVID